MWRIGTSRSFSLSLFSGLQPLKEEPMYYGGARVWFQNFQLPNSDNGPVLSSWKIFLNFFPLPSFHRSGNAAPKAGLNQLLCWLARVRSEAIFLMLQSRFRPIWPIWFPTLPLVGHLNVEEVLKWNASQKTSTATATPGLGRCSKKVFEKK